MYFMLSEDVDGIILDEVNISLSIYATITQVLYTWNLKVGEHCQRKYFVSFNCFEKKIEIVLYLGLKVFGE